MLHEGSMWMEIRGGGGLREIKLFYNRSTLKLNKNIQNTYIEDVWNVIIIYMPHRPASEPGGGGAIRT